MELIKNYGGKCVCCNEKTPEFLTIDHINEDGWKERKNYSSNYIYITLKNRGYPKDNYQLLCFNCNIGKHYRGICPHNTSGG